MLVNQERRALPARFDSGIHLCFLRQCLRLPPQNLSRPKISRRIAAGKDRSFALHDNANGYFSEQALEDFKNSLGQLGKWDSFTQTSQSLRGGMIGASYRSLPAKTIRAWTYEMPDGKLEQFQVAVVN